MSSGGKGGGGSTITGYRYYMDIHMGLGRGPIDELVEIRVGDLFAWGEAEGETATSTGSYNINKPDLFGGDQKEGGINGFFYMLMGAADQTIPDIITSNLPGPIPGWRGVATMLYYGLVCSNNPYPKAWKMRLRRALKGWSDDDCWYPEKCKIVMSNSQVATLTFQTNPADGDFVTIGGVAIRFKTDGTGSSLSDSPDATAANFITYVNDNSVDLFSVAASGSGNVVELSVASGQLPAISQVGNILISLNGGEVHAMNPAHIIYECATNQEWGRGLPRSRLDDTAFRAVADTLYDEGFGICLRWNRGEDIDKFVQTIILHIGGAIYIDRTTGLLKISLIRNDYVIDNLALFDFNSGLLDILEDDTAARDTSFNEIVVTYHDQITDLDGQVRAHDIASIQSLGQTISSTVEYMGIPTAPLAQRIAQRDLDAQSSGLRRMKVKLDRAAWFIAPGGVFRLSAPSRGVSQIVLRAGLIEDTSLTDGTITITAIEDVFSLPATTYIGVEPSSWVPPDRTAHVVSIRRIEEITYRELAANLTTADLATVTTDQGTPKVLAVRPTGLSADFVIDSATGSEAFVERAVSSWESTALLSASIEYYDTTIAFNSQTDTTFLAAGGAALIDDEYVRVDAIDLAAGTATIARGVGDTIPAPHALGTRIWFEASAPSTDGREYTTSEVVHIKLLTRSSTNKLAEADAPTDDITIGGRQGRPYPPGNLQVNSTPFGSLGAASGDIVLTWAHRDRVSEADFLLEHGAASTGPEVGTTYTLRIYDGVTLLHTITGLAGTTYTYAAATATTDGDPETITFELESVRDGLVAWQHYHFDVNRPLGFGFDFDEDFDG